MKNLCKESVVNRRVCLLLAIIALLSLIPTACDKDEPAGTATSDSSAIDTRSFTFASGIKVGDTDIGGMDYETAFKEVEANADAFVKDFTLTVVADEQEFEYKKADFSWIYDVEEALMSAAEFCESEDYDPEGVYSADLSVDVESASVEAVVEAIAEEVDVAAVDSTFSVDDGNVTISREKVGKQLDKEDLTKKISAEVTTLATGTSKTATVEAVVNEVAPKYNFESLDGEIGLIATYSTYSTNTYNGNHNMKLALDACNGSVINPGEVWSFNECTGNSNLTSLGYLPATVIINGEFEQGIGGGLCQSSSTIYNAAILANMEIVERYCHQYQSSYVPAGRDATIDYPYLDLKLSNPTDYPMYMQCYMEGTKLTVNIYGWNDPAFDYIDIESSVHSATDKGYKASAWRVYYLDDEEIDREELHSSWYDYPQDDEPETTKATKPKATQPKATKATKPQTTAAPQTKPKATTPAETLPSDPVEVTTAPAQTEATEATSENEQQIQTATAHY